MAYITNSTSYYGYQFSSRLTTLKFATDLDKIIVRLFNGSDPIYSAALYAANNAVCLYETRDIIEGYMFQKGLSLLIVDYYAESEDQSVTSATKSVSMIYCKMEISSQIYGSNIIEHIFMHTVNSKLAFPGIDDFIYFFLKANTEYKQYWRYVFTYNDSSPIVADSSAKVSNPTADTIDSFEYAYDDFLVEIKNLKGYEDTIGITLLAATLVINNKAFTLYFAQVSPTFTFYFHNPFNLPETTGFIGLITEKMSINKTEGICQGRSVFYDKSSDTEYEVKIPSFNKIHARYINEMLTAPFIELVNHGSETIEITDVDSEISSENNNVNVIEFKFKFLDRRARLDISDVLQVAGGEFTEQYDYTFS